MRVSPVEVRESSNEHPPAVQRASERDIIVPNAIEVPEQRLTGCRNNGVMTLIDIVGKVFHGLS
jgi:hypothetical protein